MQWCSDSVQPGALHFLAHGAVRSRAWLTPTVLADINTAEGSSACFITTGYRQQS
jgi:hypothetical protein